MGSRQPDLFGSSTIDPPLLCGLRYADEFVSADEAAELTARIDAAGLAPFQFHGWEGRRLTASFGCSYDFTRGRIADAPPLPDWLLPLRQRAAAFAGVPAEAFAQGLVIRYDPGAGIGWHRDRPQFGTVVGLSLGAQVTLRLRRRTGAGFQRRALRLPPRSLYLLAGEARQEWEHSIVPHGETRWSITLRTLARDLPLC